MNDPSPNHPPLTPTTTKALERFRAASDCRLERYRAWERFYAVAETIICTLSRDRADIAYFLPYSFHVVPGGVAGGRDDLAVDVIFGNRPYDASGARVTDDVRPLRLHTENGASMRYERMDSGQVLCLLYPARAERTQSRVSLVLLERIRHPDQLNKRTLSRHLSYLAAYMAVTSLDGSPTFAQRARYAFIYLKCRYAIDGQMRPSRWSIGLRKLLWWVATVGCSGAVLFVLQRYLSSPK
ncbi:hypothetical protein NB700_001874 [Xanthomonas sacchari]|uniref:Uncharacterized protein n=1 Tax=Xanthomonas sacchari TaxID=56458 RepID=A0ABT3DUZ0_9XANT|nr:hypothetical protein [Xanthomonas sacchari]MCW0399318.1 hypothetical protein [Xanthomonas sacchari]